MPREGVQVRARARIPQTDGIIPTPRCDGAAIRTERNAEHPIRMPREGAQVRARARIPQIDSPHTPRCDGEAIRTERNAIDSRSMPREGVQVRDTLLYAP
jgi:hypothetical protein